MCNPAAFVVTRTRVYWSAVSEDHQDIIEEHSIKIDGARGPNGVRVELRPPDEAFAAPLAQWRYVLDQDWLPTWYDPARIEQRVRAEARKWVRTKVIKSGQREVREGTFYVCGRARVAARETARIRAYDYAEVIAQDAASVDAWGLSSVEAFGQARVRAAENVTVTARDNASVWACQAANVFASGRASVQATGTAVLILLESTTAEATGYSDVRAHDFAQVKASGYARVSAHESARVAAGANATVRLYNQAHAYDVQDGATVRLYDDATSVAPAGPHAVVINATGERATCRVGHVSKPQSQ